MRSLQDTVYNYMTIKVLLDQNPEDHAAIETCAFFAEMMRENYSAHFVSYEVVDEEYIVMIKVEENERKFTFPSDMIDYMKDFEKDSSSGFCRK